MYLTSSTLDRFPGTQRLRSQTRTSPWLEATGLFSCHVPPVYWVVDSSFNDVTARSVALPGRYPSFNRDIHFIPTVPTYLVEYNHNHNDRGAATFVLNG